jgi:hypothetical protein
MDYTPIVVLNMGRLNDLLSKNLIDENKLLNVMNFYITYIIQNMQIQGTAEKWMVLIYLSDFSLKMMPIKFFKHVVNELSKNFMESS